MDRTAIAVTGLVAAVAALLIHGSSVRQLPVATAQPASHAFRVASGGNATCNLSVADQVKAVDTFAEMLPVFKHPRCLNCHGGFDITSDDHTGAEVAKSSGLNPRDLLNVQQRKTLHESCGECHSNISGSATRQDGTVISGWMVPPLPMLWINKSDEQLCMLVKGFEENADSFISHVDVDHGEVQFVEAAFRGDRALSAEDLDTYDVTPEPPPGTKAGLLAIARRWVKLLDGNWQPLDCGCVKPKVELIMRGEIIGKSQGQAISGEFNASVMLAPDTLSVYTGSGTVSLGNFKLPAPPNCSITHNVLPSKVVVKEVRFGTVGSDDISLLVFPDNSTGSHIITCPGFPQPLTMPVITPMQQWRFAHERDRQGTEYFFKDFEIKPQSATGRTMVGRKEITRTVSTQGVDVTAKTIFELWTVPPSQ